MTNKLTLAGGYIGRKGQVACESVAVLFLRANKMPETHRTCPDQGGSSGGAAKDGPGWTSVLSPLQKSAKVVLVYRGGGGF